MTKNKLQRIAKNKLQIGKFVKNHSNGKSLTFLLFCRNLPGKANLKILRLGLDNSFRIAMMEDEIQNSVEKESIMPKAKIYDDDSIVKVW